jgi:hypothetical protein
VIGGLDLELCVEALDLEQKPHKIFLALEQRLGAWIRRVQWCIVRQPERLSLGGDVTLEALAPLFQRLQVLTCNTLARLRKDGSRLGRPDTGCAGQENNEKERTAIHVLLPPNAHWLTSEGCNGIVAGDLRHLHDDLVAPARSRRVPTALPGRCRALQLDP